MFYSILAIAYILFVEVFIVRNVGLYFAKLNFEDKENIKKNAIMLSIYGFLYLATLAVRYIVKIMTFEMSLFLLLDLLVVFGMYVLYADFLRNDRKYWDFSFLLNIILTAVTILIFTALSVVFILFFDEIVIFVQSNKTFVSVLIALGGLLVLAVPLAVYIALGIKKGSVKKEPKPTKEEMLRKEIRARLLKEKEDEKLQAQLDSGEISQEEFDKIKEEQQPAEAVAVVKKPRCFNLVGKIVIFGLAIGILVAHMLLTVVAQNKFYSTKDIAEETIEETLTNNEYVITEKGTEQFKFLTDKKMKYDNATNMVVTKDGKKATIYFGTLQADNKDTEDINENAEGLKIISPFYDKAHQVALPSLDKQVVLGYGRYVNIDENKYYYTILLGEDFLFIEADSVEVGYTLFKTIK